ncbi:hypothetical protein AX17_004723 [Amanita inopinata Kibby_2008]|nr:hypothetical protein AX17_004723 [Amanita inopinata Kibby_2008]
MTPDRQVKQIIVLGAGVIGLSTGIKILEKGGYKVTIVAEILPTDPKDIRYASHFAGAQHVTAASRDNPRQNRIDRETFDTMWELSEPGSHAEGCFLRLSQTELYGGNKQPAPLEGYPNHRVLTDDELPPDATSGVTFDSLTTDTPMYLSYLMSRFFSSGGSIIRGSVQHIDQLLKGGINAFARRNKSDPVIPDALVICAGLGARFLGGVEDKTLYPVRGQTVLLRAPWVKFGKTISDNRGLWTYVIPRRSGDVIIGGTKAYRDWHPLVRPEITRDILERTLAMCPELAPSGIRKEREPTVDDIIPLILEENVGLRPSRDAGIRLEVELFEGTEEKSKIPVVYNYGHGGYGFIGSWGSATKALELLEEALAQL